MFLRVDDRLLHGQVAVAWTSKLQADFIIIANDASASSPMMKMSLKLAKPAGADLRILTLEEAVKILNDKRILQKRVLVIVETIRDAYTLCSEASLITEINLGGIRQSKEIDKKMINKQIFLNNDEVTILEQLSDLGKDVFGQVAPLDGKLSLKQIKESFIKGGID